MEKDKREDSGIGEEGQKKGERRKRKKKFDERKIYAGVKKVSIAGGGPGSE